MQKGGREAQLQVNSWPAGSPSQGACSFLGPPQVTGNVGSAGCMKRPPQPTHMHILVPPVRVSWSTVLSPAHTSSLPGQFHMVLLTAPEPTSPSGPVGAEKAGAALALPVWRGTTRSSVHFYLLLWPVGWLCFPTIQVELNLQKAVQTGNCRGAINITFPSSPFFPPSFIFPPNK